MRSSIRLGLCAAILLGFGACTSGGSSTDGNTSWLTLCTDGTDCAAGMTCACGVCTPRCASESACAGLASGAACVPPNLLGEACGASPSGPVCVKLCVSASDCPAPLSCAGGVCVAGSSPDAGGGGRSGRGGAGAGGRSAGAGAAGNGASGDGGGASGGGTGRAGDGNGGARSDAGSGGAGGSTPADAGDARGGAGGASPVDGGTASGGGGSLGDASMDADSATSGRDAASGEVAFGDAGPTVVTSVVAGLYHACAIVNGGVQCWGRNDGKQLGNPSVGDYSTVPVPVEGLGCGVSSVCAGYHHTCAVVNGGVKCWGSNDEGQLGTAAVTGATAVPVPVPGLTNVEAIACGRDHTCALHVGGIDCWGDNSYSELGSTGVQSPGPHGVTGVFPGGSVTAIAANGHGTCAIVNGGLECWGDDTYGQLGNGVAGVNAFVPYQPPGLASGVSSVAIGDGESVCAVVNGGVQCSGNAFYGVSGFPSEKHVFTPLPKPLDSGVQALSSGYEFTCALVNGAALCWGDNGAGQLGSGSGPYVLGLQSGVQSITTGDYFACALVNGTVWCWGWDMDGQLARGRIVGGSYLAEPVTGLRAIPSCPYNHCLDHQLNGDETGVDCGGECPECALGEPCAADSDCISNACDGESLQCVFVQCSDHRKDGDETDTDCGGPSCGGCWNGAHCAHNFDCLSGFCSAHVCQ